MATLCTVPSNETLNSLSSDCEASLRRLPVNLADASLVAGWERISCHSEASTPSTSGSLNSECTARSRVSRADEANLSAPYVSLEAVHMRRSNDAATATFGEDPCCTSIGNTAISETDCNQVFLDTSLPLPLVLPMASRHDPLNRTASEMRLCSDMYAGARRPSGGDLGILDRKVSSPTLEGRFPPRSKALSLLVARQMSIERDLRQHGRREVWDGSQDGTDDVMASKERHEKEEEGFANADAALPVAGGSPRETSEESSGFFSWFRWLGTGASADDELELATDHEHEPSVSCTRSSEHEAEDLHTGTITLMQELGLNEAGPVISGAIVLTGKLEEQPEIICNALREALLSSVEYDTSSELIIVCVWKGPDFAASAGQTVVAAEGQLSSLSLDACSFERFSFQIMATDPAYKLPVLKSLLLEAASAGARRFLPALVDSFSEVGRLAVRLEVTHTRV